MTTLDLNADLGESFGAWRLGDDEALLDVVTSANVACGFHAGDPVTMRETCAAASERGVAVGAHPSYRDLVGFGRRFLDVGPGELEADVLAQLGTLSAFCRVTGARLAYVKPHGALYHACGHDAGQAAAVVRAVAAWDPGLAVLGAPGSELLRRAEAAGLRPVAEAFADRAYQPDGTLVPRSATGAVLADAGAARRQAVRLATDGVVEAIDGSMVRVGAESLCVHGDTPGSVGLARAVRAGLEAAGVRVASFA